MISGEGAGGAFITEAEHGCKKVKAETNMEDSLLDVLIESCRKLLHH